MCLSLGTLTSNHLTQIVNFANQIPECHSHSPAPLNLLLSSDASIYFTMAFAPLGNSDHVVVSVFIDFPTNSKQDAVSLRGLGGFILVLIGTVFVII